MSNIGEDSIYQADDQEESRISRLVEYAGKEIDHDWYVQECNEEYTIRYASVPRNQEED